MYRLLLITPPLYGSGVLRSICLYVCVCLSVCLSVREHISGTAGPIITKLCVQIPCGRGLTLLEQRCDTLCTSGLMDDVTFGRSGPYDAWKAEPQPTSWRRCDTGAESDVYECLVNCCHYHCSYMQYSDHRFYHCSLVIWVTADCRALMEISISLTGTIQSVTLSHLEGLFKVIQGQMENQKENLI